MALVKGGTTSWRGFRFRVFDSDGAPYTGATSATAGAAAGYTRTGSTRTAITLSDLAAVDSAFSAGGIKHIAAGWYRLDVADAAIAAGVDEVTVDIAFTDYTVVCEKIQILGADLRTDFVATLAGTIDVSLKAILGTLLTEGAAGRIVANFKTFFNVASATGTQDVIPTTTAVTNRVTANTDQIEGVDATDYFATLDDATLAAIAAVSAFVDTEVAAIKAKTDNLPTDPADQSAVEAAITAATSPLATAAALAAVAGFVDTEVAAILAAVDTEVAAIKLKTDNLPSDPADQSAVEAAITAAVAPLATAAAVAAISLLVDELETRLTAARAGNLDALADWTGTIRQALRAMATKNAGEASADLTGGSSSYVNTTDALEAIRDRGDTAWGGGGSLAGSGAILYTYTVTSLGNPVDGVEVWVTTDEAGDNVVAGTLITDAFGVVEFMLDEGDYFVWSQKAGYNFTNPDPVTVD